MPSIPPQQPRVVLGIAPRLQASSQAAPLLLEPALCGCEASSDLLRLRRLQEVLKVAIFGEDIGERLLDDIVGGCVDEGGILIDLCSGCVGEPIEALICRVWMTSSSGIAFSFMGEIRRSFCGQSCVALSPQSPAHEQSKVQRESRSDGGIRAS